LKNIYKLLHVIALVMIYFCLGSSQLNAQFTPHSFTMRSIGEFPETPNDAVKFMTTVETGYILFIGKSIDLSRSAAGNHIVKLESVHNIDPAQFIKTNN